MTTPAARLLAIGVLLIAGACQAQSASPAAPDSPEWVVEQFYARKSFPDRAKHVMGELTGPGADSSTIGSQLSAAARVTSHAVMRDSTRAVFATAIHDGENAADLYTYLYRVDGAWKIAEIRALAVPGFLETVRDSLRKMRDRPDSLTAMLRNVELTLASDSALKAYFTAHHAALDAIATEFAASGAPSVSSDERGNPRAASIAAKLRALDLSAVERDDELGACVLVSVGGILDNTVGYLRTEGSCRAPEMNPHHYIYVEQLAPGWYLYKTT